MFARHWPIERGYSQNDPSPGLIVTQAIPQFLDRLLDRLLTFRLGHGELVAVLVGIDLEIISQTLNGKLPNFHVGIIQHFEQVGESPFGLVAVPYR